MASIVSYMGCPQASHGLHAHKLFTDGLSFPQIVLMLTIRLAMGCHSDGQNLTRGCSQSSQMFAVICPQVVQRMALKVLLSL